MKLLKYVPLTLALASCASNSQLYQVTHVIAESDSTVDVWSSNAFIRTDIQITRDSIHFFEALGEYNKMIKTESIDFANVLEVTDSTLTIQQPDQVTTYLLFNLENHYE
tara:strand:- start:185 stop:511 length:327 start_codon:yes stop_codon:yes gene_type:complete